MPFVGIGVGVGRQRFASGGFDADYQAVLNYATTQGYSLPSASQQVLQNQLLLDLKTGGIWNKLDTFGVFATDGDSDFALIDWIRLTDYTAVNTPTFTTNQGYASDGASSYINTNYNPLVDGVNSQENDSSGGAYQFNVSLATSIFGGARISFTIREMVFMNTRHRWLANQTVGAYTATTGFTQWGKTSSTTGYVRNDGTDYPLTGLVTGNNQLPNFDFYFLAVNTNGAAGLYSDAGNPFGIFFIGASLDSEKANFETAINTYISAL
jgi:hypothetical protein